MENSKKLIRLAAEDNVLVVCQNIPSGVTITFENATYHIENDIALGHKIAATNIKKGDSIIKFNVSIGSATEDIKQGAHVHIHNMKSDFIPTYVIEE